MTKSPLGSNMEIRALFHDLGVWQEEGVRAPCTPLLLLYTLGRYAHGGARLIKFEGMEDALPKLFQEFGPPGAKFDGVAPFWSLRDSGVWETSESETVGARKANASTPTKAWLRTHKIAGGFTPELFSEVAGDSSLLRDIAGDLLESHFPGTLHGEIMAAVGLDPALGVPPSRRDPKFRDLILRAYEGRCAVCAFDARLGDSLVGLEAAHIRWHQAGGPSTVTNGIALCSLHSKLLDRGAFTLTEDRRVLVSAELRGSAATEQWITRYHGSKLRVPRRPANRPDPAFIAWHRREVFREPGRPLT